MARTTFLGCAGALLLLACPALAGTLPDLPLPDLAIQVEQPEIWRGLFAGVGVEPTTNPARLRIVIGDDPAAVALGFRPTDDTVTVASVVDERAPELRIVWREPADLPAYEIPEAATVFVREKRKGAPLLAGLRRDSSALLWAALGPGDQGFERFPYLMHALVDLGLRLPFRDNSRHIFFDSSYRARVDLDYMARRWRRGGVHALHIAAWHFTDTGPDEYLEKLITACHREGILAYAWLELPHVSEPFWAAEPGLPRADGGRYRMQGSTGASSLTSPTRIAFPERRRAFRNSSTDTTGMGSISPSCTSNRCTGLRIRRGSLP